MEPENINQDDYSYLCQNYNWFDNSFVPAIQKATDEFFGEGFKTYLLGISKNVNPLMEKESYFVTKVKIDELFDVFFRLSEDCVSLILDKALGKVPKKFSFNKISDLEAKVITSFNDYLYNSTAGNLLPPPPTVKRANFDVINLTFIIKDTEMDISAKFIITIPQTLLNPESVVSSAEKFNNTDFASSTIDATINIGSTRFSVFDLKNIDTDDIVVFENSDLKHLNMKFKDFEGTINIKPNLGLVLPIDNEEESKMSKEGTTNLWDSIEVEMNAQFDSVKITLGELKNIEEGLVVDLASIYDNKVTLSVEDKVIAKGELVIVNDKYGVKIDEVIAGGATAGEQQQSQPDENGEVPEYNETPVDENGGEEGDLPISDENNGGEQGGENDEDFDYSDFELEDEDI